MTTYSTSLKLTLIGDGEQTGTWGQTTNTNLGTLLEEAIVGQTTIIMANADYTLTNLNGTTDEARNAVLVITGNQNASYSVIVPAVPKLYIVTNSLNTSAIAYIKPSGGSTFQVPNGRTMYLYTNGSQFYALDYVQYAQNLVTGGGVITGAISCTSLTSSGAIIGTTINGTTIGGTTITASTQFSGPGTGLTGSAPSLTAGNISGILAVNQGGTGATAKTGTGDNVLNTSPTLVTPILGTPTSGNLANCTGYPSSAISGTINLATQVTGVLPVLNGGTGSSTSTGTGSVVLSTSPTLISPILGAPTSGNLVNCTSLPLTTGVTGILPIANGGSGTSISTGTGSLVLSNSPSLTTPVLGTPTSGNLSNCTSYPTSQLTGTISLTSQVTGTLPVTNGGTGVTTSTGTGNVVLSTSPSLTTPSLSSPALTGTPTAPTASAGTSTTQVATTAFATAAIQALYPVGAIYSSTVATNPGTLFGFGTWVAFAAGQVMIGNGSGFTAGTTGGSADATLVTHSHGGLTGTQSQDHSHAIGITTSVENQGHVHVNGSGGIGVVGPLSGAGGGLEEGAGAPNYILSDMGNPNVTHTHDVNGNTGGTSVNHQHGITTEGSSATNANLQPYIVVYMWNRTA